MKKTSTLMMVAICAAAMLQVSCKSSVKTSAKKDADPQLVAGNGVFTPDSDISINPQIDTSANLGGDLLASDSNGAYGQAIPAQCLTYLNQQRDVYPTTLIASNLGTFENSIQFQSELAYCQQYLGNYMQGPVWNGYNRDVQNGYSDITPIGVGGVVGSGYARPIGGCSSGNCGVHSGSVYGGGCSSGNCGVQSGSVYGGGCSNGTCGVQSGSVYGGHSSCGSNAYGVSGCSNYYQPGIVGAAVIGARNTLRATGNLLFGGCGTRCY